MSSNPSTHPKAKPSKFGSGDILEAAKIHFGWLETDHHFSFVQRTETDIEILSDKVALRISFSPDLPQLFLIRPNRKGSTDLLDLWEFMVAKRRDLISSCFKNMPSAATFNERSTLMLEVLSCALQTAGSDIIKGQFTD